VNIHQTGTYTLEYFRIDRAGNTGNTVTRTIYLLDPNGDDDSDGYTNKEEIDNGTDPRNPYDKPTDTTPPVVTLNGSGIINILLDESYTEEGADWTDNLDGTGSISYPTNGTVNVHQTGTYILEYFRTDRAGNTGNTVTRTIYLLDPNGDDDSDSYTNKEEIDNGTDPHNPSDKPTDTTPPIVTLNGSGEITLLLDESYTEEGADWTDNFDGTGTISSPTS
jgi:hypothetical protein